MSHVAEPVLSVRALAKRYGNREALRDVSFDLHEGELVAVVGPNGAGKTTLLSILVGVQSASGGSVDGLAMTQRKRAIGWAPQRPALYSKLSVQENLRLFAHLEGIEDVDGAVTRMLDQTGLRARAREPVERLSGGNRQRVNVALGLIAEPQVLALDEPSAALDPGQRARLWQVVGSLADAGTTVLFSTHHLSEVRRYASRAIVLADGELLFDGSPRELLDAPEGGPERGAQGADPEGTFVAFLQERGH